MRWKRLLVACSIPLMVGALIAAAIAGPSGVLAHSDRAHSTKTTIQHVVVIFQENVSFDHYFGTYPNATNPAGEPKFTARKNTPSVNGLTNVLLNDNPNSANPRRLDRNQAVTCDQSHGYTAEQQAFDGGLMDRFVEDTAGGSCADKSIVMDYYDGNTVTALWNLAQNFAMSDNSYSTAFGPSSPGAVNLISGNTHGAVGTTGVENNTLYSDADPRFD